MSAQTQIDRIKANIAAAYSMVQQKGGVVPAVQNSENLVAAIETIPDCRDTFEWFSPHMTSNNAPTPYVATATSEYNEPGILYPTWHAFDGNPNTFWHIGNADVGKDTTYIQLDFGESVSAIGVRLKPRPGFISQLPKTFDLLGSIDGSAFEKFYQADALGLLVDDWYQYMLITEAKYRYFRFVFTSASTNHYGATALGEIEFKKKVAVTASGAAEIEI